MRGAYQVLGGERQKGGTLHTEEEGNTGQTGKNMHSGGGLEIGGGAEREAKKEKGESGNKRRMGA